MQTRTPNWQCLLASFSVLLSGQFLSAQTPSVESKAVEVVTLSPFEVKSQSATGYKASNAVTASRFALPVLDTPVSIQVVTEEFMRDIGARDALESLSYVSGLTQGSDSIRLEGSTNLNIRGVNTTFTLRDGIQSYGIYDGYNIQRWEVLKGVTGMMYGSKNLGGLVNAVTKKPQAKAAQEVYLRVDQRGSHRVQLDSTGPLVANGKLNYRLMGFNKDDRTGVEFEKLRSRGLTGSVEWRPFTSTKIIMEGELYLQENTLGTKLVPLQNAAGPRFVGDNGMNGGAFWRQPETYYAPSRSFNYGGPGAYLDEKMALFSITLDQKLTSWLSFRGYGILSDRSQDRLNRDGGSSFKEVAPSTAATPRQVYDFRTGLFSPESAANSFATITNMNSNLRDLTNEDMMFRGDFLADYYALRIKHRTLVGYEWRRERGNQWRFDAYSPVSLINGNPYAANQTTSPGNSAGQVNVDLRTFDPRLPMPSREEIVARLTAQNSSGAYLYGFNRQNFASNQNDKKAVYAVHYVQFWDDRATIMAGWREDQGRQNYRYTLDRDLTTRGYDANNGRTPWRSDASPQVGVSVRVLKDVSLYASWADVIVALNGPTTAYFGDMVAQPGGGYIAGPRTEQEPQRGVNKEVGIKTDLMDGRFSSSLTFFQTNLVNKPFTIFATDASNVNIGTPIAPFDYTVLAGEDETKGAEYDLTYQVRNNWSVVFSYAYTDSKIVRDSTRFSFDTDPAPGNQNLSVPQFQGNTGGNIPRNQFKIWNQYRMTAGSGLLKDAAFGFGYRWYDSSVRSNHVVNQKLIHPAYGIVDFSISKAVKIAGKRLGMLLRVNNVLDEQYIATQQVYGDPRTVVFEARYSF